MPEKTYLEKTSGDEISDKNMAIRTYDKMMCTVRSGFLLLLFGGRGFVIQAAIGKKGNNYY